MRTLIIFFLTLSAASAQLPSMIERAAQREKTRKENEARRNAEAEKRKAAEAERKAGVADRRAAEAAGREEAAAAKAEAEAKAPAAADSTPAAGSPAGARSRAAASASGSSRSRTKPSGTESQGISGPIHEKYMKKVVFFKSNMAFDEVKESEIASEFSLTDPMFFRVYMEKTTPEALQPLAPDMQLNQLANQMFYGIRFSVAGKPPLDLQFHQFSGNRENQQWTTWRGVFLKSETGDSDVPGNAGESIFREFLARATQKNLLVAGKNKVNVEVYPFLALKKFGEPSHTGEVIATGEFTLNYNPALITSSNPKFCVPYKAATQRDPAIEAQILRYAQGNWTPTEYKPVKVMQTQNNWTIYRHPVSGIILRRMIEAVVVSKGADYCRYQGYQYSQVHEGSAYSNAGTFTSADKSYYMPCGCLVK